MAKLYKGYHAVILVKSQFCHIVMLFGKNFITA